MSSVLLADVVTGLVCRWRGHRWAGFNAVAADPLMRYAARDYCTCCLSARLRFRDGDELVVGKADVVRLSPDWMEGLYRARWGEYPRQRVTVGGAMPEEWLW